MIVEFYPSPKVPDSFYGFDDELYTPQELQIRGNVTVDHEHLIGTVIAMDGDKVVGRLACYLNPSHVIEKQVGAIGYYECINDEKVAHSLLQKAKEVFAEKGVEKMIGPMNGSTWNTYRFRTGKNPLFFAEMMHKSYYLDHFKSFSFKKHANYVSNVTSLPDKSEVNLPEGYSLRTIDLDDYESEMKLVFPFFEQTFASALFYSSITEEAFLTKYRAYKPYLKSELIWFLEKEGQVVAVMFGLHNHFDPTGKSAIIKTLARLDGPNFKGTGAILMKQFYNVLIDGGYERVIHAMMRADNAGALKTSDKFAAEVYSQYELLVHG